MLQENNEALPGFAIAGKQKSTQTSNPGRGQDIQAYTCYLKNLTRSVPAILGLQDKDTESTRKF